jgi:hypothetical protein
VRTSAGGARGAPSSPPSPLTSRPSTPGGFGSTSERFSDASGLQGLVGGRLLPGNRTSAGNPLAAPRHG